MNVSYLLESKSDQLIYKTQRQSGYLNLGLSLSLFNYPIRAKIQFLIYRCIISYQTIKYY